MHQNHRHMMFLRYIEEKGLDLSVMNELEIYEGVVRRIGREPGSVSQETIRTAVSSVDETKEELSLTTEQTVAETVQEKPKRVAPPPKKKKDVTAG